MLLYQRLVRFPNRTITVNLRNIICPLDVFSPEIDVECVFGQLLYFVGASLARDIRRTVASTARSYRRHRASKALPQENQALN